MSSFIHIADTHIYDNHKYSIDGSRLKAISHNLLLIVKYAKKKKIQTIIIAGDIFHIYNPSEKLLKVITKFIRIAIKHGVNVRLLTGNHDTDGINYALESLNDIDNLYNNVVGSEEQATLSIFPLKPDSVAIYTEVIDNTNYVYVPWQENLPKVLLASKEYKVKDKFNVLVAHGAVDAASTNSGHSMKNTKITRKVLSGWDYVALGDFHKYQCLGENIYYSGSISKTVWDERFDDRAFNFVNFDTLSGISINKIKLPDSTFIELKLKYSEIEKYLDDGIEEINDKKIKGAFIKLFISEQIGYGEKVIELKKHLIKNGAMDVFYKMLKNVDSNSVKIDDDEIHINLDVRNACKLYLKKKNNKAGNDYMKYLDNKIMDVM